MSEPISLAVVGNIFRVMRGRFGTAFVDKYRTGVKDSDGKDIGLIEAMEVWAHELRSLSAADIQRGMDQRFKFPPSADEFVQACYRDVDYAAIQPKQHLALAAPRLTAEEIDERIALARKSFRRMTPQTDNGLRLDWAYTIAEETKRGVYQGGTHCKRIAALALKNSNRTVPDSLKPFLSKADQEEAA